MKATASYSLREGQTQSQLLIDIMTGVSPFASPNGNYFALNGAIKALELQNGGCLIVPHVQLNDDSQVAQNPVYYSGESPGEAKHYYAANVIVTIIAPDDEFSRKVIGALNALHPKYASATEISLENYLQATNQPPKQMHKPRFSLCRFHLG